MLSRKIFAAVLVAALALSGVAYASPSDKGTPMDATTRTLSAREIAFPTNLPANYSLTNLGEVTPVKLQNPWGDCWAFAIASALESSILKASHKQEVEETAATAAADAKVSSAAAAATDASAAAAATAATEAAEAVEAAEAAEAAEIAEAAEAAEIAEAADAPVTEAPPQLLQLNTTVDLSERTIAWFAHQLQTEASAGNQAGEGFSLTDSNNYMNQLSEGNFKMIESLLAAGQIVVSEQTVPYQYNDYSANPPWYSLGYFDGASNDARKKDWSVDDALRFDETINYKITDVFHLSSPAQIKDETFLGMTEYTGYDEEATLGIKRALMDVGAVAIALDSESSIPKEITQDNSNYTGSSDHFSYDTWSQFNGSSLVDYNHAVAIVGWDDSYSAANFSGTKSGQPPADGAWLCKNNWGSDALFDSLGENSSTHWGIRADASSGLPFAGAGAGAGSGASAYAGADAGAGADIAQSENTQASGFFWLSYYDHSIQDPTAFGVAPSSETLKTTYQYDYMGSSQFLTPSTYKNGVWTGNVFTAEEVELLRAISVETFAPNERVNVEIYSLGTGAIPGTGATSDTDGAETSTTQISVTSEDLTKMQLRASASATLSTSGFHTLELNKPVLLSKGERFFVASQVLVASEDGKVGSYLNLEVAFSESPESVGFIKGNVVANPGETFVSIKPGEWIAVDPNDPDFKAEVIEPFGEGIEYGNALVKAYSGETTMSKRGQIYSTETLNNVIKKLS